MATLFEIGAELEALNALLDEVGGDISDPTVEEAVAAWFAEIATDEGAKLEQYACLIRLWETEAEVARVEAKAFAARAAAREKNIDRLKARMLGYLQASNRTFAKTKTGRTISIRVNGGKTAIVYTGGATPDTVSSQFTRRELDTETIRAALDRGEQLSFAKLAERGVHLRVTNGVDSTN
jgi:hypothetical protein